MKLSARNQLKGTVTAVNEGAVEAQVTIDIGGGNEITSVITVSAVKELGLAVGMPAIAVIKADHVMLATD